MIPIILCGGVGQRLWPVSREATPKPFMRVGGKSFLERTVARAAKVPGVSHYAVVTNSSYTPQITDERKNVQCVSALSIEPQPRLGDDLGEGDTLRLADNYGRAD
jgi:mannose-1-phosphate guanylyltransferase / mannose-6-phosphate isomerase